MFYYRVLLINCVAITIMQNNNSRINVVSVSLAGISEAMVVRPFENIKTTMQFKGNDLNIKRTSYEIYKKNGLTGFYKGIVPSVLFNVPKVLTRFYSYNVSSKFLQDKSFHKNSSLILSGLFSGFVESSLVTVPTETIKTKILRFPHMNVFNIVKENGVRGLYLGYFPTLYRQSLNNVSRFYFFNTYKEHVSKKETFTNMHSFYGGVGAGLFSGIITSPMDILKTQMQEETTKQKSSMIHLSKTIYNTYGLTGFWRGNLARSMCIAPGQGMIFLTINLFE